MQKKKKIDEKKKSSRNKMKRKIFLVFTKTFWTIHLNVFHISNKTFIELSAHIR